MAGKMSDFRDYALHFLSPFSTAIDRSRTENNIYATAWPAYHCGPHLLDRRLTAYEFPAASFADIRNFHFTYQRQSLPA